jgi:hypothetical protein
MLEPAPPRTAHPVRQVVVFLGITYAITLRIALALPHAGIAPLISIAVPVIAVALTTTFVVPRGQRRAIWATVGFRLRRGRGLLIAVLGPVAIIALSFGAATALGVVRFPGLAPGFGLSVLNLALTTVIFAVVFLGEEIWLAGVPTLPPGRGDLRTTCGPPDRRLSRDFPSAIGDEPPRRAD